MLIRHNADGAVAITQPHHAWLAGELARAWGAPGFAVPEPRDALLCAIGLHDIGWLDWERAPSFDPQTGYPLQFDKVDATIHTKLWSAGVEAAGVYGVLPALHISRHGVAIYELTFDFENAQPEQAEAVCTFIREQVTFQQTEVEKLARRTEVMPFVTAEHLEMTKRFIVAVDTLSLHLCWGIADRIAIDDVPTTDGTAHIVLTRKSEHELSVDPWPFSVATLDVIVEGKQLKPARDQRGLLNVLHHAATVFSHITLTPR